MSDNNTPNNEITLQCSLLAPEETLRFLWQVMAQTTELINSLLHHINTHPDKDIWITNGELPASVVDSFIKAAKTQPPYQEIPSRFITSAQNLVKVMFKSWFEIQRRKRLSLIGKQRFFAILKSDEELLTESGCNFDNLCLEAQKILKENQEKVEKKHQNTNQPPLTNEEKIFWEITNALHEAHNKAKTNLTRCAIALLLKNQNQIPSKPEDPEKYQKRRLKKAEEIKRLKEQLQAKFPKGRQIDQKEWLNILELAKVPITEVEEFNDIQAQLLRKFSTIVYPVTFGSNTDLKWFTNEQGRICVQFHGMRNYTFEIACDKRQLHWFQRFLSDYELYKQQKQQLPTGLMPLRCARLVWTEGKDDNGKTLATCLVPFLIQHKLYQLLWTLLKNYRIVQKPPWKIHHLHLHCAVDYRLWTKQGTEAVKAEKIVKTEKLINSFQEKQKNGLTSEQQKKFKANQTSLHLLKACDYFTPSSRANYQGNPHRILGVNVGLQEPVTIAIMDTSTGKVLAYRSTKQLLSRKRKVRDKQPKVPKGKERQHFTNVYREISDYELFVSYKQQKYRNKHQRHKAQIKSAPNNSKEANIGLTINRLFARAIIEIAQEYQVSTIILPDMKNKREIIECEVLAKAQLKIPGDKKAQLNYAKDFRTLVNEWSYLQLSKCISSKAAQVGIAVETIRQIPQGTPYERAKRIISDFVKKANPECSI